MASTPTSRYKVRKQGVGDNVNTWGDTLLNTVLDTVDRGSKGYQFITLTGDLTLSWSDYSSSNQGQVAILNLAGSLAASANLIVPSTEWAWDSIINNTGATVTIKTSAGTGIALPNGRRIAAYCDGTDVYSAVPNYLPVDIVETNNRDLVDFGALNTAIANVSVAGGTGPVRISSADTTAGFLRDKVTTSISGALTLQLGTLNPGGNEQLQISGSVGTSALSDGGEQTAGFNAASNTKYRVRWSTPQTITLPASPSAGDQIQIAYATTATTTLGRNGNLINNLASDFPVLPGYFTDIYTYNATAGWR
jgi:hypothetical protein